MPVYFGASLGLPSGAGLSKKTTDQFDIFIIGYGKDGPGAFIFFNHDTHGLRPWTVLDIPYIVTTPVLHDARFEALSRSPDPRSMMLSVMQHQCDANPDLVGGTVTETIIDRDQIRIVTQGKLHSAVKPVPRITDWTA